MFKLFRRKLNKKGFTLAELLVVVAIIAILVAIAIPIFTGALDRAQIGVNTANARSIKGAAVSEILNDWSELSAGQSTDGTQGTGWQAAGKIAANGDVEEIYVYVAKEAPDAKEKMLVYTADDGGAGDDDPLAALATDGTVTLTKKLTAASITGGTATPVAKSGKIKPDYWVIVYIDDVKKISTGEGTA